MSRGEFGDGAVDRGASSSPCACSGRSSVSHGFQDSSRGTDWNHFEWRLVRTLLPRRCTRYPSPFIPIDPSRSTIRADWVAAQRRLEFWIGHYADPVYLTGDYPASMREQLGDRLPEFTPQESALLKGSSDFYGMNTYTSDYIQDKTTPPDEEDYLGNIIATKVGPDGNQMGPHAESFWLQDGMSPLCLDFRAMLLCYAALVKGANRSDTVPWGFRKILNWAWNRYCLPIYVTENGFSIVNENKFTLEEALHDTARVDYYEGYLNALLEAVVIDGVKILGYMAWSLMEYTPPIPALPILNPVGPLTLALGCEIED